MNFKYRPDIDRLRAIEVVGGLQSMARDEEKNIEKLISIYNSFIKEWD